MARSTVNRMYDASTDFRAPGLAAVTATAVVGVLPLDKMVNVRPSTQRNKLGAQGYEVVIVVSAWTAVTPDETYVFTVQTGGATPAVTVGTLAVTATGQYIIPIDAQSIENLDPERTNIELNITIAGTAPSITFSAWLALA